MYFSWLVSRMIVIQLQSVFKIAKQVKCINVCHAINFLYYYYFITKPQLNPALFLNCFRFLIVIFQVILKAIFIMLAV